MALSRRSLSVLLLVDMQVLLLLLLLCWPSHRNCLLWLQLLTSYVQVGQSSPGDSCNSVFYL